MSAFRVTTTSNTTITAAVPPPALGRDMNPTKTTPVFPNNSNDAFCSSSLSLITDGDDQSISNNDSDFSLYTATTHAECCCFSSTCKNQQLWMRIVQKLENDARLAAAIGQSLLLQHEQYVSDTNQTKRMMERQLDSYQEQIHKLQQVQDATDVVKQELEDDKKKWIMKWKRTQKTLDATAADFEAANSRCITLSKTLQVKEAEVERLQVYEAMIKKANAHEDAWRTKLEDAQQEIEASRRSEKLSEARFRKMKEKHDAIQIAHGQLQRSIEEERHHIDLSYRSNSKLRSNALKKMSSKRQQPPSPALLKPSQSTPTTVDANSGNSSKEFQKNSWPQADPSAQPPPTPPYVPFIITPSPSTPVPTSTTTNEDKDGYSSAIHHHHHHYYYMDQQEKNNSSSSMYNGAETTKDLSELGALHSNVTQMLERLHATDMLALNRQLGRAFDMDHVSQLSNTMIDQILSETEEEVALIVTTAADTATDDMVAIVRLCQDMIKEIGQLRATLNDLQAEYVNKIQENGTRVEKELMQRRQQRKQNKV
ncbi:hypothetical protein BDB00DRAFT_872140 [Zychaea mexicana]|uniref:uncharacterized protein n=1 Tax=Zychaea mexicana TaxID=64656 RepID=UPI0022FEF1C2|nr:uncharacterized protein BDB00DRAFT_872140 [Zychaea mexicana]KAI9493669.1 hypothetical protein BDB00DRAFT_872140 [Zychaea mexicana]